MLTRKSGCYTVDGSEILRSPVEGKVVYPIICRVLAPFLVFFFSDFWWEPSFGRGRLEP